jgi:hypothetical protein
MEDDKKKVARGENLSTFHGAFLSAKKLQL